MNEGETFDRAFQLQRQGDWQKARELYAAILAVNPDNAGAWHMHGVVLHRLGNSSAAIDSLECAIRLNPKVADFHNNLGAVHYDVGNRKVSQNYFVKAIALRPDYADPLVNLARIARDIGQLTEAKQLVLQALAISTAHAEGWQLLGLIDVATGEIPLAYQHLRNARELQPNSTSVALRFSHVCCSLGKFDEAAKNLADLVVGHPNDSNLRIRLGEAHELRGDVASARNAFATSAVLPSNPIGTLRQALAFPIVFQTQEEIDFYRRQLTSVIHELTDQRFLASPVDLQQWGCIPPYALEHQLENNVAIKSALSKLIAGCIPTTEPRPSPNGPILCPSP